MKLSIKVSVFLLAVVFVSSVVAEPCGKDGMTALRANNGSGFLFYLLRNGPDIYFALGGKEISFPNGTNGPRRFVIDNIMYESLIVKPKEFIGSEQGLADLEILKRHQRYEFSHMQSTPTPLKEFVELGARTKRAAAGQPGFTYYLWIATTPNDPKGARQYFLTTVSNSEVVVLTAIVKNETAAGLAMQTFESYVSSFQHVLKKEDCPAK